MLLLPSGAGVAGFTGTVGVAVATGAAACETTGELPVPDIPTWVASGSAAVDRGTAGAAGNSLGEFTVTIAGPAVRAIGRGGFYLASGAATPRRARSALRPEDCPARLLRRPGRRTVA